MDIVDLKFLKTIKTRPSRKLLEDKAEFREATEKRMAKATADELMAMSAKEELSPLETKAHDLICGVLPILDLNGVKMYIGTELQKYQSNLDLTDYAITISITSMPKKERQLKEVKTALFETLRKGGLLEVDLGFSLPPLEI